MQLIFSLLLFVILRTKGIEFEEIYGSGEYAKKPSTFAHLSSSTEDLKKLLQIEKSIWKAYQNDSTFQPYYQEIEYEENNNLEDYLLHPINAFHLIQRCAKWYPKLFQPNSEYFHIFEHPNLLLEQSAYGLVDLQVFHDFDIGKLVEGIIEDPVTNQEFISMKKLNLAEVLECAKAAKSSEYYHMHVKWLEMALTMVPGQNHKLVKSLENKIEKARKLHDDIFNKANNKALNKNIDRALTWEKPYQVTKNNKESLKRRKNFRKKYVDFFGSFVKNLKKDDSGEIRNFAHADNLATWHQYPMIFHDRIQKLCRNQFVRPAYLDMTTKCQYLHHNHPYLRLGPFKYELLHSTPEIAYLHDFVTLEETEAIKSHASGKLKSTPYTSDSKFTSYSRRRTSKVMYINDNLNQNARKISNKIEQLTQCVLKKTPFDSENYQVMNYGIGGFISIHSDSSSGKKNEPESVEFGGLRFITFMIYLSNVQSGGRTIFPQVGISVPPTQGSALYWFNKGADMSPDSRNFHLGCPVSYGNKWIANKWIKHTAQFRNYQCFDHGGPDGAHFSIMK